MGRGKSLVWNYTLRFSSTFTEKDHLKVWKDENPEIVKKRSFRVGSQDEETPVEEITEFFTNIEATKQNFMEAPYNATHADGSKGLG